MVVPQVEQTEAGQVAFPALEAPQAVQMAAQPAPLQAVLQVGQMVALRGAVQASLELVAQPVVPQVEQKVDQLALSQEVQMVVRSVLPRVAQQVR